MPKIIMLLRKVVRTVPMIRLVGFLRNRKSFTFSGYLKIVKLLIKHGAKAEDDIVRDNYSLVRLNGVRKN